MRPLIVLLLLLILGWEGSMGQQLFRNEARIRPGSVHAGTFFSHTQFELRGSRSGQQQLYDTYWPGHNVVSQYQLVEPPTFSQYIEELGQNGGGVEGSMQWHYGAWNVGFGPRMGLGHQPRKSTYRYAYTDTTHTGTDTNLYMKVSNRESYMTLLAGAELNFVSPALVRRLSLQASIYVGQQVQFLRTWEQTAERTVSYRDSVSRVYRDTLHSQIRGKELVFPEWRISVGLMYHLSRSTSIWMRLSNRAPLTSPKPGIPISAQELGVGVVWFLPNQTMSYYRREY